MENSVAINKDKNSLGDKLRGRAAAAAAAQKTCRRLKFSRNLRGTSEE
jgi:hypothetical protein